MKKFLVTHAVKPEFIPTYKQATLEMLRKSKQEHSARSIELFEEVEGGGNFHLLETFSGESDYRAHGESPHFRLWQGTLQESGMLAEPETRRLVQGLQVEKPAAAGIGPDSRVSLRTVHDENVRDVMSLKVSEDQESFVAPNERSLAQAYAAGDGAWVRAIYADEVPVGFTMMSINLETHRYYLWRYMIDSRYQGFGFGKKALEQVIDFVRTLPEAAEMFLSYVPEEGGPKGFYEKMGFRDTGREEWGELEMRLAL